VQKRKPGNPKNGLTGGCFEKTVRRIDALQTIEGITLGADAWDKFFCFHD
jgi:hypothetical protein